MIRKIALAAAGMSCLLSAAEGPNPPARVSKTEHFEFATGGTIHLKNSIGELDIQGWDRPDVELTTVKSPKYGHDAKVLDQVRVETVREGSDLTIRSEFPKHTPIERPFRGETDFDLEYHIKAPRTAKLDISHDMGEVTIDGITADVRATDCLGDILLHLPDGAYAIDARSKLGSVQSDFAGDPHRRHFFGEQFANPGTGTKLYLRIGFGDIMIIKIHQPPAPDLK